MMEPAAQTMPTRNPKSIRLCHLVPETILSRYGAGNWKDVQGRTLLLKQLGVAAEPIGFEVEHDEAVVENIPVDTTDILLEYSGRPELMERLSKHCPDARIHMRMHNAEALQHWHRAEIGILPSRNNLRNVYGVARLAWMDRRSAAIASSRLGISLWDNQNYWRRICGKPNLFLPYFCPWPELRQNAAKSQDSHAEVRVLCMPGGGDRLSRQQSDLFGRLADQICAVKPDWQFQISAGVHGSASAPSPNVSIQKLDQPWETLLQSRAVAVLTDLGFGMKTTIIDGLAAGAHVLVHTGLIKRLPDEIASAVIPVDFSDPKLTESVVAQLESPATEGPAINHSMRELALRTLAEVLDVECNPTSNVTHATAERSRG